MNQETLQKITEEILSLFRSSATFKDTIPMKDYHGFEKGRIPSEALETIAARYAVTAEELQVELVRVTKDLSDEVHVHHHSRAYCIILGKQEGLETPRDAFAYIDNQWSSVREGEAINIPPQTAHGFTVKRGGILYFLSVQTPPIEDGHGHDDYERVERVEEFV